MSIDVLGCARCGGDHLRLAFTQFTRVPVSGYQFFALCPTTLEPILVRMRGVDEPVSEAPIGVPS